jgi:hypothetical protein
MHARKGNSPTYQNREISSIEAYFFELSEHQNTELIFQNECNYFSKIRMAEEM